MLLRRFTTALVLVLALAALAIVTMGIATTAHVHVVVRDVRREVDLMCDLEERSRWAPAPLERSWCAAHGERPPYPPVLGVAAMFVTEVGVPARELAYRTPEHDIARWRRELARGMPATEGETPVDTAAFRHAFCQEHDPSSFGEAPPELEHALVALLADASRMSADDCLAESAIVVQLAQRLAHTPVHWAYDDALGTTGLVGRTVARCAATASPAALRRAAQELDALASHPPPWIGPSTWEKYVLARQVASFLEAGAENVTLFWPWTTDGSGESHRAWLRDRARLAIGSARPVRRACDADAGAVPLSEALAEHALLRLQHRSSACLRELAAAMRERASDDAISEHAIVERTPSCSASPPPRR